VVLSDLKMGGSDGMDVLRTTALHPTTAVILMTAFGTVNTAVEAAKIDAFDYVQAVRDRGDGGQDRPASSGRLKTGSSISATPSRIATTSKIVGSSPHSRVLDIVRRSPEQRPCSSAAKRAPARLIAGAILTTRSGRRAAVKVNARRFEEPARIGTLRAGKCVHGRGQAAHRTVRAGRRRHPLLDEIGDMSASTRAKICACSRA
jgi:hypothetical protein